VQLEQIPLLVVNGDDDRDVHDRLGLAIEQIPGFGLSGIEEHAAPRG
jgi:hypothetical protein